MRAHAAEVVHRQYSISLERDADPTDRRERPVQGRLEDAPPALTQMIRHSLRTTIWHPKEHRRERESTPVQHQEGTCRSRNELLLSARTAHGQDPDRHDERPESSLEPAYEEPERDPGHAQSERRTRAPALRFATLDEETAAEDDLRR